MERTVLFLIAVAIITILILVSATHNLEKSKQQQRATSSEVTTVANVETSTERFIAARNAPKQSDYEKDLLSRTWDAQIFTYPVPGVVAKYNEEEGSAVFSQENGEDLKLEVDWGTDSDDYSFSDWRLNADSGGFTVAYGGRTLHATIEKSGKNRYSISIFDSDNSIQRLIVITH
jgi:hypothetical protein